MRLGGQRVVAKVPSELLQEDPGPWVADRIKMAYSVRKATLKTDQEEYQLMSFFPRLPRALTRRLSEEVRATAASNMVPPPDAPSPAPSVSGSSAPSAPAAGKGLQKGSAAMQTPSPARPRSVAEDEDLFGEGADANASNSVGPQRLDNQMDSAAAEEEEDVPSPTT